MMGINAKTLPGILLCAILAIPCWLFRTAFSFLSAVQSSLLSSVLLLVHYSHLGNEKKRAPALDLRLKKSYNGPLSFSALVLTSPKYCM